MSGELGEGISHSRPVTFFRKRSRDEYETNTQAGLTKRVRYDDAQTPSKVLHVRKLPADVVDNDLAQLAMPFGRVANVLLLHGKGQGFIQMEDVAQAVSVVQYYSSVAANIRGQTVFLQFSNRNEITSSSAQPVREQKT